MLSSAWIRPRMKRPMATGTSVTLSRLAAAMASVLVQASGSNSRPSCASSAKTGRKETVMISSEKKRDGPTSRAERTTASQRSPVVSTPVCSRSAPSPSPTFGSRFERIARSRCLWRFSTITIAASIMAPMAMAIPPRLMMSAPIPIHRMAMNAIRMPTGSVRMATRALRTWKRKSTHTRATTRLSSRSFSFRVSMARWMRSERS